MHPYLQLLAAIFLLAVFILPSWYIADMRSILKSGRRKQELSIAGDWKGLEDYYEEEARTRRPFVWFRRKYLIPGHLETLYALFLYEQGRFEEALAKAEQAIERNKSKLRIFRSFDAKATFTTLRGALKARTLILGGLGRYDEARAAAAEYQKLAGSSGRTDSSLALLEYYCGQLDEAITLAQAARPEDSEFDAMRGVVSLCYTMKGDFEQALQALSYAPADVMKFYTPTGLQALSQSPEGAELLEAKRQKLASVFPPARFINLARVYVAMEDFEKADQALDEAEKSVGPQPGLQVSYCRYRACSFAGQGKAKEAELYLDRMRAFVKTFPKRSLLWETHFGAGRSYLYLNRFNDALAELDAAQKCVLHPVEKHGTNYYIAKAHEATGNQSEAIKYYELVAADPIPSRMRQQAAEVLAARK